MAPRPDPAVYEIETLRAPEFYSPAQIRLAVRVAHLLKRGKLVLVEEPRA